MKYNFWSLPERYEKTELLIVACTSHFFGDDYVQPIRAPQGFDSPIHCEFTNDLSRINAADALWFHCPSIRRMPEKRAHQKWILMSMESDKNYPLLRNNDFMNLFDIHMTYRLDSDVPAIYPNWREYGTFLDSPASIEEKNATNALAAYIASNPVADRDDYVKELMSYIPVHSLGRCLNNTVIDGFVTGPNIWVRGRGESVKQTIRRYKFYLAFENSITTDYVTERAFRALATGTVPIYRGADNAREFMPHEDAIIHVDDFDSVKDMAEYLLYLHHNDDAYQRHLHWKTQGLSKQFKALVDIGSIDPRFRLAVKLAHGCSRECRCGGRIRDR